MTRHPTPNVHDQAAHHWLTQHQHALTDALDDLLDTEAGLREILLHSHHDTATDNLDTVLDTEAGLAAILPISQTTPADTPHHHTDTTDLLRALSPAQRMTLRNNPDVKTASQALDRDVTRTLDLDLAFEVAGDLADAIVRDLTRAGFHLAFDSASDLARILDRVRDLDGAPRDLDRASARALARARALDLVLDLVRDLDLARASDLDLDLDLARVRVRDLARALDLVRDLDLVGDLDPGIMVEIRTAEVGRAIGLALHREPLMVDKDSLPALLDDFTTTDLSNVDLTGIDLSGVRWSELTTQWPSAIDIEDLKARSDEAPPGSGVWIVRSGTATVRDLAEW